MFLMKCAYILLSYLQVLQPFSRILNVKNHGRFCVAEEKQCACVCVRERERESRDTKSVDIENTQVENVLTKEEDPTSYKVGGGCFI